LRIPLKEMSETNASCQLAVAAGGLKSLIGRIGEFK